MLSHRKTGKDTLFKNWTINKVVQYLHGADKTAVLSLTDEERFVESKSEPKVLREMINPTMKGAELLATWWNYFQDMCQSLGESDSKRRVPWVGPDMGVKMFTTARQMETWAHGQNIYDLLKIPRVNTDRLKKLPLSAFAPMAGPLPIARWNLRGLRLTSNSMRHLATPENLATPRVTIMSPVPLSSSATWLRRGTT